MPWREPIVRGAVGELFWNVSEPVVILDGETVLGWNPGAERAFGISAEEALADGVDLDKIFGTAGAQLRALIEEGGETELSCTDGCRLVLVAKAWHLDNDPAQPTVVVFRDITASRRQIAGLEALNRLGRVMASADTLEAPLQQIVDAAKTITDARFSALIVLRDGSEIEIQHFLYNAPRDLFPTRLPRAVGLLAVPIATRSVARLDDIRGHPAGEGIPVRHPPIAALLAAPVLAGDRVLGEIAVANAPGDRAFDEVDEALMVELAGLVAMTISLFAAREAQVQAEDEHRALMGLALHNIRTPLTIAKGFVATLRTRYAELSEQTREESLEAVDRALDRIHGLSEGALLQDWRPPSATPAAPDDVVVTTRALIDELVADLAPIAGNRELVADVEEGAPAAFPSIATLAREILETLVSNAIKHSDDGTRVSLTARRQGDSIRFDVSDEGPGISPSAQSRLFRPPDNVRVGLSGPAGSQGLWIVKRLADRLGGTVGVSSRVGEGSTFWVTFPAPMGTHPS
jgi:signal transduction histidine kinase